MEHDRQQFVQFGGEQASRIRAPLLGGQGDVLPAGPITIHPHLRPTPSLDMRSRGLVGPGMTAEVNDYVVRVYGEPFPLVCDDGVGAILKAGAQAHGGEASAYNPRP